MAQRPIFVVEERGGNFVEKDVVEFKWYPGFSKKQKRKSIRSLHSNSTIDNDKILEISTKSECDLGIKLSAFNLELEAYNNQTSVETIFQSSKVFTEGGPYKDLLDKNAVEAKTDQRLNNSGDLLYFQFKKQKWPLEPKTLFYDWIYINALVENKNLNKKLLNYSAFTDIEFNPKKSINCQAKSAALYVSLVKRRKLKEVMSSPKKFREVIYNNTKKEKNKQLKIKFRE